MVLLIVDTQKGIVDERLYAFETFVSNIKELIRTAREQGIEVVYVQHDDGPGTGFFFERTAYGLDEPFFSQQWRKPGIDLEFIVPDGKARAGPIVMLDIDDLDSLFAGSPD